MLFKSAKFYLDPNEIRMFKGDLSEPPVKPCVSSHLR